MEQEFNFEEIKQKALEHLSLVSLYLVKMVLLLLY